MIPYKIKGGTSMTSNIIKDGGGNFIWEIERRQIVKEREIDLPRSWNECGRKIFIV